MIESLQRLCITYLSKVVQSGLIFHEPLTSCAVLKRSFHLQSSLLLIVLLCLPAAAEEAQPSPLLWDHTSLFENVDPAKLQLEKMLDENPGQPLGTTEPFNDKWFPPITYDRKLMAVMAEASPPPKEPPGSVSEDDLGFGSSGPEYSIPYEAIHPEKYGTIFTADDGSEQILDIDGTIVFRARRLRKAHGSENGWFTFLAYSGWPAYQTDLSVVNGESVNAGASGEVWVIAPGGKPTRITPPNLDAISPSLSPDGRYLAFGGSFRNARGRTGDWLLFLVDLQEGKVRSIATSKDVVEVNPHRIATPSRWIENGAILSVIEQADGICVEPKMTLRFVKVN